MAVLNFSFRKPDHKIGKRIDADVFVKFAPNWSRKIARHPVEKGSDISDHIILDPKIVTIEGVISDCPLDYKIIYTTPDFQARVKDVYDELVRMWKDTDSTSLVDIVSGDKEFKNMCLTSLTAPDDESNGMALKFSATFEEFRLIEKKYVDVEYISTRLNASTEGAPESDVGNQPLGEVEGDKPSLAIRAIDKLVELTVR